MVLLFQLIGCLVFESGEITLESNQCADVELCDGIDNDCDDELSAEVGP